MPSLYYPCMIDVGVAAAAAPFMHVFWKRKKRLNKFLEKLPDALDLMSRALSAGQPLTLSPFNTHCLAGGGGCAVNTCVLEA